MAKTKDFAQGIDALLGGNRLQKPEPKKELEKGSSTSKTRTVDMESEQLKEVTAQPEEGSDRRITVMMPLTLYDRIRAVAYWERKSLKETITSALSGYLEDKGSQYVDTALKEYQIDGKGRR